MMDEAIVPQFEKHLHHLIRQHGSIEDLEWFAEYAKSRNSYKAQVEQLTKLNDKNFKSAEEWAKTWKDENAANDKLRNTLIWIREYWNQDENEKAMSDACWKVIEIANDALEGGE